jgi:nucleoside-diphosphate-sugar epimerase
MYLITGGAGFIGSNVAEALVKDGKRVRVFDNFSTGSIDNLAGFRDRVDVVEGDLRDYEAVRSAMKGVEYVCHQAALRAVQRSVDDPLSSDAVNVHGTLHVLEAARQSGSAKRVVYASSSSVYGDDPTLPKREDQRPSPVSPYAVSKLAAEHYCRVFTKLYGLETVSLRYFNVFGPRQSPLSQYAAVVPLFMHAALRGEPIEVHGDGEQSRDFTHIDNVVQANILSCSMPGVGGEAFNIACGERHSLLEIAGIIGGFVGRELERRHVSPRAGDVRHTLADITKAQRLLGFRTLVGFEDGLRRTFDWLKASG